MEMLPPALRDAVDELGRICRDSNHTTEEVVEATQRVHEERDRAISENTEYADMLRRNREKRRREVTSRTRSVKAEMESTKLSIKAKVAADLARLNDANVNEWVQQHKVRVQSPEEAEAQANDKLACPNPACKDHGKNRGNILNGVPTCMVCWHQLVPKSELPHKNRKYWRAWNKKK